LKEDRDDNNDSIDDENDTFFSTFVKMFDLKTGLNGFFSSWHFKANY